MRGRKNILVAFGVAIVLLLTPAVASAQTMTSQDTNKSSMSSAEQKGQDIYNQLQNQQATCDTLTNDDFDVLGDFYMGRMMGSSAHNVMDQQMTQRMGDTANTEVHIALAKRLSGCVPNASYPATTANYAPVAGMTGMMGSGNMINSYWNMMGGYWNSYWSGTDTALAVLLVLAIVAALVGWLRPTHSTKKDTK